MALGRVIVEGFIDFDYEITLLTVRALGAEGEIATHFCEPIGHIQVAGDYVESWQPHPMNPVALQRHARSRAASPTDLGGTGIFGVELFVKGDEVWFSEVSPRPHDTGMVTMATQWQNEFELHARALLGLPVDAVAAQPGASAVIYGGHDAGRWLSTAWPRPWRCRAPTCACSASPSRSASAAWVWRSPAPRDDRGRARARQGRRGAGPADARASAASNAGAGESRPFPAARPAKRAVYNRRIRDAAPAPDTPMKILVVDDHSLITDALRSCSSTSTPGPRC